MLPTANSPHVLLIIPAIFLTPCPFRPFLRQLCVSVGDSRGAAPRTTRTLMRGCPALLWCADKPTAARIGRASAARRCLLKIRAPCRSQLISCGRPSCRMEAHTKKMSTPAARGGVYPQYKSQARLYRAPPNQTIFPPRGS
jgi:hypothetical protein